MKKQIAILTFLSIVQLGSQTNEPRSLPLVAPLDPVMQAKDALIVKKEMQIELLQEQLRLERTSVLMPKQSVPDFLIFRAIGDGDWKMTSRDTNYTFLAISNRVLIHLK